MASRCARCRRLTLAPADHRRPILAQIEKVFLGFESFINRLIGSDQLNPFYHTGTISVFFLLLVGLTGLYLTIFTLHPVSARALPIAP